MNLKFLVGFFWNLGIIIIFFLIGKISTGNEVLSLEDIVEADLSFFEKSENIANTKMPLDTIYEDDYMLILNKPAKIPVHPSMRHFDDTLSNGVKYYFDKLRY